LEYESNVKMNAADDKDEGPTHREQERIGAEVERRLTMINNRLNSRDLFIDTHEIVILHGRDAYHLRLTAQNKLILTK
jgi:hemin uptake protein HemP